MHYAASKGNADIVQYLCRDGVDANVADGNAVTPFYWSIYNDHEGVVRVLWEASVDKHQLLSLDATPLYIAAAEGHLDMVIFVCNLCPQPAWCFDQPPAADYDVLRYLCDIDVQEVEPAHEIASNQGHIECARWLYFYSGLPR